MAKKILSLLKLSKAFYIALIPIIYLSINRGIHQAKRYSIEKYTVENHSSVKNIIPNIRIGIVYGIVSFLILTAIWICILKLISILLKDDIFFKKFFTLGEMSVNSIITKIFYIGIIQVVYLSYNYRIILGALSRFSNWQNLSSNIIIYYSLFNSIIGFIIIFLILLALWKLVCELMIIIFRCFEIYYDRRRSNIKE